MSKKRAWFLARDLSEPPTQEMNVPSIALPTNSWPVTAAGVALSIKETSTKAKTNYARLGYPSKLAQAQIQAIADPNTDSAVRKTLLASLSS